MFQRNGWPCDRRYDIILYDIINDMQRQHKFAHGRIQVLIMATGSLPPLQAVVIGGTGAIGNCLVGELLKEKVHA